jgi:hypothetical protein
LRDELVAKPEQDPKEGGTARGVILPTRQRQHAGGRLNEMDEPALSEDQ